MVLAATVAACSTVIGLGDVPTPADSSVPGDDGGHDMVDAPSVDAPHDSSVADTLSNTDSATGADGAIDVASPGSDGSSDAPAGDAPHEATTLPPDSGTAVSLTDCVLLMHMEEASWSGAGSVVDSSGTGNSGSPVGDATTTASGKFGRGALFSGTGYIDVPDSLSLHPTGALTYAAWFYSTGFTSDSLYPGIISKRVDYANDVAFTMFLWTGNTLWGDLEGSRFNSSATFVNGQWYHVAIVYDGSIADSNSRASMYVNGTLDSVHPAGTALSSHASDLTIGFLPQGGRVDSTAYFIGRIDEVAIWNRALSAGEIQSLASATGPL